VKGVRAAGEVWDTDHKEVEYMVLRHRYKSPHQAAHGVGANKLSYYTAVGLPMYYTDVKTPKDTRVSNISTYPLRTL
jgi:hypothetical protein